MAKVLNSSTTLPNNSTAGGGCMSACVYIRTGKSDIVCACDNEFPRVWCAWFCAYVLAYVFECVMCEV